MNSGTSHSPVAFLSTVQALMVNARRIALAMFVGVLIPSIASAVTITYVQSNSAVPQSSPTSVAVAFTGAQTAGNLNVVVVGWNNSTATVSAVTDSQGNSYVRAVGPTVVKGFVSQSIYYAKNILGAAAGSNTVTVQFASAAAFPDIRILEYSGADLANPVDVTSASSGNSASSNSGAVTTTNATDLIFGANMVVSHTTGPGSGFTSRMITSPDGDIAEDKMVTTIGSYSAVAPISPSARWIMQMVAFRTPVAGGDTTPPTAPSGLTATALSGTQINLAWTAATDNVGVTGYLVERCQGSGCSAFAQIASQAAVTYNDTTAVNGTSYSYRVRATDAAGNLSAYSNIASATTPDTQAPTAPAGLSATAASATQINLTWTASSDNVGVTQYLIESCQGAGCSTFTQIGTATGTTFSNIGLIAATSYSYRVRATDAAGNLSAYSSVASAVTLTGPDTQPPTAPSNLAAPASGASEIDLTWTASSDDVGVTNYFVERCQGVGCSTFTQVGTSTAASYSDLSVNGSTTYSYRVRATDAAGNLSSYSNVANVTTAVAGLPVFVAEAHSATDGFGAGANTSTLTLNVSGNNNLLIAAWHAEFDGGIPDLWTVTNNGVPGTLIVQTDGYTGGSGNRRFRIYYWLNPPSGPNSIVVALPYTGPNELAVSAILLTNVSPTTPLGAITVDVSTAARTGESETVNSGSSDLVVHVIADALVARGILGVGETSRSIANDGLHTQDGDASLWVSTKPGDPGSTTVSSSGWASRTINGVGIAVHGSGSGAPSNLTATPVSSSQINLTWTPPTGFTVANYLIERCQGSGCSNFAQVGTSASPAFNDTGLTASTSYSYQVRATDGAGNFTGYSNIATALTGSVADTQPPTAPSALGATAASGTQVNLSWTASTDNVGVTNYFIERCQGSGCTTFTQIGTSTAVIYNDATATNATAYSYRVLATDAAGNLSGYSNVASTTTPDTQAPTAPTGLGATAVSAAQINLSWTASTDNVGVTGYRVERCQGSGCTTFAQIATPTGTTYSDVAVTNGTSYSYRVRATDAAGNLSGYSNVASATTPDTQAPTAPTSLVATTVSGTQINLSWTGSTDNVGVASYLIESCSGTGCTTYAQIASVTGTTYSNTGLIAGSSYSYRVRATDAAGNLSGYSNVASATTMAADTQPPTAPSNLAATAAGSTQINLTWTASTDNIGVTGYQLERCQGAGCTTFAQIATPSGTTFSNTGLTPGTSYSYRVRATDAAGNLSGYSNVSSATTSASTGLVAAYGFDEGSGTTVTDFSGQGNTGTIVNATWATTGKFGKALSFNGTNAQVTIPDAASLHLTNGMTLEAWVNPTTVSSAWRDVIYKGGNDNYLLEGTTNHSSAPGGGATLGTADTIVFGMAALAVNTWTHLAVTYDGAALRFYVNGVQVSTQAITGAILQSSTPLQIGGDTFFGQWFAGMIDEVRVYNVALTAAQIQTDMGVQVSTPDTQPPTTPTNLTATAASGSQINLSWTASTDNVGVTQYLVESCQGAGCTTFTQIGTATGTAFISSGLIAANSYSYRVRAGDAANNLSGYSNVATATTLAPDTQPPTTPSNLTATAISGSQINLSWGASTDNVGVTGYLIERCQGVGCNNFGRLFTVTGTTYNDTALVSNTSYTYQVKATDAAGNFSPYSNTATATTLNTISGLVAAYSFDEGSGTTVNDLSGSGNIGTLVNATWSASGKYGSALSFNGTNARVTVNDSPSLHLANAMTLEAWVNPTTVTSAWRDVIYKGGNDNYLLEATTNHSAVPGGGATVGATDLIVFGTSPLTVNTWTHLAVTYDGASVRFYVNGALIANTGITGSILGSNSQLQIGGDGTFGQYFAGLIDEVRIYNVALTPTQITADMAIPVGGGGSAPLVSLSPSSLSFGSQQTGTSSASKPVTLSNIGNAPLSITSIAISGGNAADFSQTNNCGASVAAGSSCVINVTFTPTTTGSRISSVVITDNAVGSPHSVAVSGTGTGFQVNPRVAVLTFTQTQQFMASGTLTWSVDGVVGGNATSGTITQTGLYTPPAAVGTHTVTATGTQTASSTVYVSNYAGTYTYHNDNLRTGVNGGELVLTPSNVNSAQFGKLFSYPIDGWAFASPLYVANVNIPNQGFHNVVYIATEHDSVYAYDADGLSPNPLWQVSFLGSGVTTMPCVDVGECGDIPNEIGITGTPAIDQATGTMYVVAKTKENNNYVQRLHALDITTGAEKFGGPVVIQASVTGNGVDAVGNTITFNSFKENQRPGLLLNNGVVYVAFAAHGDQAPWHGWVIGYNATTLQRTMAWCVSPNGYGGGIWQGGAGLSTDATGNIFFTTGNGDFNANTGGPDYGDSVLKLGPSGTVVDYFTPFDQGIMEQQNVELSSAGPVLLIDQPGATPHRLVTAAKTGTIYVVNRDNMGHFQSGSDSQIIQSLPGILPHGGQEAGNYSAPVFFNGNIYFGAVNDNLKIFRFTNGVLSSTPVSQSAVTYPNRGASFAVSANGTSNGILWAVQDNTPSTAALRAYDANNLATELYNSTQAGTRDTLGFATKFSIPLVVNGKVFVVSQTGIVAYGLLP